MKKKFFLVILAAFAAPVLLAQGSEFELGIGRQQVTNQLQDTQLESDIRMLEEKYKLSNGLVLKKTADWAIGLDLNLGAKYEKFLYYYADFYLIPNVNYEITFPLNDGTDLTLRGKAGINKLYMYGGLGLQFRLQPLEFFCLYAGADAGGVMTMISTYGGVDLKLTGTSLGLLNFGLDTSTEFLLNFAYRAGAGIKLIMPFGMSFAFNAHYNNITNGIYTGLGLGFNF